MTIRTTNFDAVAASAPIDRQASVTRDGSGDLWDGGVPDGCAHWEAPPLPEAPRPDAAPPMEGVQFGRMTVVRYHKSRKKTGAHWLCRCSCGDYELRKTATIRSHVGTDHACQKCEWLKHVVYLQGQNTRSDEVALLERLAGARRNASQAPGKSDESAANADDQTQ